MTFKQRLKAAASALRGKSATAEDMSLNQLLDWLGVQRGLTGEALSEATYFACLKVLSESLGKLPMKVQQYTPGRGIRVAREHPFYRMLNERPNRYMTASTFWGTMELCRNHKGNAYAWIDTRDPARPQLWVMDPGAVQVWYDNARILGDQPDLYYRWSTPGGVRILGSEEVLHFKSHMTFDGLTGVSVCDQLASTIKGNVEAQGMLNALYKSGMTAKSVLQYTGGLNPENVKTFLREFRKYTTDAGNQAGGVADVVPLPEGFTLTPLNIKLADSQFQEIKQYSALQIASAFGVKPYQVGDYTKSSYASAEAQQLSFLVDTLLYIVKQYEEEIAYKLLNDREEADGYHVKVATGVLLRTDPRTQTETLREAVNAGLRTRNEARELLDLPAMPGGDILTCNGATIPVEMVGAQYAQPEPEPAEEPEDEPAEDEEETPAEEPEEEPDDTDGEEDKAWKKTRLTKRQPRA